MRISRKSLGGGSALIVDMLLQALVQDAGGFAEQKCFVGVSLTCEAFGDGAQIDDVDGKPPNGQRVVRSGLSRFNDVEQYPWIGDPVTAGISATNRSDLDKEIEEEGSMLLASQVFGSVEFIVGLGEPSPVEANAVCQTA